MKKHFYLFGSFLMAAMIFVACGGGDDEPQNSVPAPITVGYELPAPKGGSSIVITHYGTLNEKSGQTGANYSVEWDTQRRAQRWSACKMCKSLNVANVSRYDKSHTVDKTLSVSTGTYPNDPDLPAQYHFTSDPYWGKYDHGHIIASQDRVCSEQANRQTFYMTNMQPQGNKFNAGIWANMESQVRTWASRYDTLYVCKGGTIDEGTVDGNNKVYGYIGSGNNQIPVPRYFFMAIVGRKGNVFKATGFWIDQFSYSSSTLRNYAISISELQKKTGIDFFYSLPDNIENQVETSSPYDGWY